MRLTAKTAGVPGSQNGHHDQYSDISKSRATSYLSAAAHLRRPMLPDEITDPGAIDARPPLPVGRAYAVRVLFGAGGVIPISSVDMRKVKKHCLIALLQTTIRDLTAIAAVATFLAIEPWGTAITLGTVAAITIFAGRARFFVPLMIAGAVCLALALVNGSPSERVSLGTPLACLAVFFIIYLADILLSIRRVRKIWWQPSPRQKSAAQRKRRRSGRALTAEPATTAGWLYTSSKGNGSGPADLDGWSSSQAELDEHDNSRQIPSVSAPARVYYDKYGIVGAGTAQVPLTLTLPLDKPLDPDSEIRMFSAAELIAYIGIHLLSQGTGDPSVHGFAYKPPSTDGDEPARHESGHFTYGLPYLDVGPVVATPAPKVKKIPAVRITVLSLNYHHRPSSDDILGVTNRSPSEHPERHYVRASTSSWDGQLLASVYLNAALQGHFLRVIIRPYVLAPIVADLQVADELATRHPFILTCMALAMTARQFLTAAERLHGLFNKADSSAKADAARPGLHSTREHYAQLGIDNMHQREDSSRIIDILERKIIGVTMDYLREQNIDIEEYEQRILNQTNIIGDGNITGTISNSQVNSVTGQGSSAANTTTGKK